MGTTMLKNWTRYEATRNEIMRHNTKLSRSFIYLETERKT